MKKYTFEVQLSDFAKKFGYDLDIDPLEDVYHEGYSKKSVLKMSLNLPSNFEKIEKLFPYSVSNALEQVERDAFVVAIRKARISALITALEKIDLMGGGAEYVDMNGKMVSEKGGVSSAEANEENDTLSITVYNPVHLINSIINGVGRYAPDLSEDDSYDSIKSKLYHLKDYFDVYGESKPKGELSAGFYPYTNQDDFIYILEENISCLTKEEVADYVKESIDSGLLNVNEALDLATRVTDFSAKEISQSIIDGLKSSLDDWNKKLSQWN